MTNKSKISQKNRTLNPDGGVHLPCAPPPPYWLSIPNKFQSSPKRNRHFVETALHL